MDRSGHSRELSISEMGLFQLIFDGKYRLEAIVTDWMKLYHNEREVATNQLIQFIVESSGCTEKNRDSLMMTLDNEILIDKFKFKFNEEYGTKYPMVMSGAKWRRFKDNFGIFMQMIIRQGQNDIIFDEYLMTTLTSKLIALSNTKIRAFRHTAIAAVMNVMTALVKADVALTTIINDYNRRIERKRKADDDLMMTWVSCKNDNQMKSDDIRVLIENLLKRVFRLGYRDVVPEIRRMCIAELGKWCKLLPNHFIQDKYLRFFGWNINDFNDSVRLASLEAIYVLANNRETFMKIGLFISKFSNRLAEMCYDKDLSVALLAIKILIIVIKRSEQLLIPDKSIIKISQQMYSMQSVIGRAAGQFFIESLLTVHQRKLDHFNDEDKIDKLLFSKIINFHIKIEIYKSCAYLVDSLINAYPKLTDMKFMIDWLLEDLDEEQDEDALNTDEQLILIDIMVCSFVQIQSDAPVGRNPSKFSSKLQNDVSKNMVKALPKLLAKFKNEADKIEKLVCIPQYCKVNLILDQTNFERILKIINQIIEIHSDKELLKEAAKSYAHLFNSNELRFNVIIKKYQDNLLTSFKCQYNEAIKNLDLEHEIVLNLIKKISIFYLALDLSSLEIYDDAFRWIRNCKFDNSYELLKSAIKICHMDFIWTLDRFETSDEVSDEELIDGQLKLTNFVKEMENLLRFGSDPIKKKVIAILLI